MNSYCLSRLSDICQLIQDNKIAKYLILSISNLGKIGMTDSCIWENIYLSEFLSAFKEVSFCLYLIWKNKIIKLQSKMQAEISGFVMAKNKTVIEFMSTSN